MFELLYNGPDAQVAIVVAHQDDESIGFASILAHCPGALVVHVTDGSPQDESEWHKAGSREAYRHIRAAELCEALNRAGHHGPRVALGVSDTEALLHVGAIASKLIRLFAEHGIQQVFTHAYEGGHPDHDAVAFAVHATGVASIIEAPFYRMDGDEAVWQNFEPFGDFREFAVHLDDDLADVKRRMLDAHVSQVATCAKASRTLERFRVALRYDFSEPPNRGRLSRNYLRAGIDADGLVTIFTAALARLS